MAKEIEVVIKVSEEVYNKIREGGFWLESGLQLSDAYDAIKYGTPLPKGHGRLIDADALNRKDVNCANVPMNFIDTAQTIIEADKEAENENSN